MIKPKTLRLAQARSQGLCERCGRRMATDWGMRGYLWSVHHRRAKAMGGSKKRPHTDCACNLAILCGSGTTWCHGEVTSRQTMGRQQGFIVSQYRDEPFRDPVHCHDGWFWFRCDGGKDPYPGDQAVTEGGTDAGEAQRK